MNPPIFVHLNCHSCYSMASGADSLDSLFAQASTLGMETIALTDTNGMYGAVPAQKRADKQGIRLIIGAVVDRPEPDIRSGARIGDFPVGPGGTGHAVLLARDLDGYSEISRLITARHLDPDFDLAMATAALGGKVIVISSDLPVLEAGRFAGREQSMYVQLINNGDTASRHQISYLLRLAKRLDLPVAATNNVHFTTPEKYQTHRLLSAIRTNATIHRLPPGAVASPQAWLKPASLMDRLFAELPHANHNTTVISDQCHCRLELGKVKFPAYSLPAGVAPEEHLRALAYRGASERYPSLPPAVMARLEHELAIISKLAYAEYFMIVNDIAAEARRRGIPTVGRGSAANSLVCYALRITDVCPLRYNLYFERFLNLERGDCPDIDLDFPWNRRDEILEYVYGTFGNDRVAMISTHATFRGRSIIREVGKAMGLPKEEIDPFAERVPGFTRLSDLAAARDTVPECRGLPMEDEPYRSIISAGLAIEGFPRHLSIHCGGIVVAPCPITDLVPLQRSTNGLVITQFDMYPIEDMGLVKIDLLGQRALAVVVDTMEEVRRDHGLALDWERIDPLEDEATRALMRSGQTIGCFYIESPGMRALLKKLAVDDFETLVAASSIIRPGVSDSGMMKAYIDRRLGREEPVYPLPAMREVLGDTFGVMVYQEDVIKVANRVAGLSLGQADGLRRCMSKKRDWEAFDKYKKMFMEGAVGRGAPMPVAQEIWRQMESFGGYAFCKAHSASFAVISYRTAYLKAHYPAQFMAAVIANRGGFYNAVEYVEEARRMGLVILGPDVNQSAEETEGAMAHRLQSPEAAQLEGSAGMGWEESRDCALVTTENR
ncbi:MAG: DNA polymerase III subunit alpha [Nitrospinota bacterium]|nr:DNA polymerase III subunit alpha [Nitrospinota bacterium]